MASAEVRYRSALELYRSTDMSVREICAQTGNSVRAFRVYVQRNHRDLMLARHGVEVSPEKVADTKVRGQWGQSSRTHAKYKEAVLACDDAQYIACNVSEIARMFNLSPAGLANQLRNHFPEIIERREKERQRLGLNDNRHRGAKKFTREQYAGAVDHLRNSNDSIRQAAELFDISYSGLREHLLAYHKDLVDSRLQKREESEGSRKRGGLMGNGKRHLPSEEQMAKYEKAVSLYRNTKLSFKEIADTEGVTVRGLRNYIRMWHTDLMHDAR